MIRNSLVITLILTLTLMTAAMPGTVIAEEHEESQEILRDIHGLIDEINEGIQEFNGEIEGAEPVEEFAPLNASNAMEADEEATRLEQESNEKKSLVVKRTAEEINYQAQQRGYENLELLDPNEVNNPDAARNATNMIQDLVDAGLVEPADGEEAIQALNDIADLSEAIATLEGNASRLRDVDWEAINEYGYEAGDQGDNDSMDTGGDEQPDDNREDTEDGGEGLPGFTFIAALIASVSLVTAHIARRR